MSEYFHRQDEDLALITAQQFYIDFGNILAPERLQNQIHQYIPDSYLNNKSINYWVQKTYDTYKTTYFTKASLQALKFACVIINNFLSY